MYMHFHWVFKMHSSDQNSLGAHQGVSHALKTNIKKRKFTGEYNQFDFHFGGVNAILTNNMLFVEKCLQMKYSNHLSYLTFWNKK